MLKKIADIICWTIIITAIGLLVVSFVDIILNNNSINPTYQPWNIIVKYIDWAIK